MKITFLIIKQSIFKIFWWFKMHWVQCTELHKLIYLKSIKTINKYIKNWYHCWFQNFSNAQVADFKPPKNRLPVGILKFRKNVLVQKVLGYSKLKQSGIVLYFHYLIHLIPGPGLNCHYITWMLMFLSSLLYKKTTNHYFILLHRD